MDRDRLNALLDGFARGDLERDELVEMLARLPFQALGDARVDTHRSLRNGVPEVVLGEGKTVDQIARIVRVLRDAGGDVLVTRVSAEQARALIAAVPGLEHLAAGRLLVLRQTPLVPRGRGVIAVVSAGTSDLPVAEEAALVAEHFGNKVERVYDSGVSGLHRLLASLETLRGASVVIAVAGMEGALASVVGGLVAVPVIAVPTSIGYGASFGGVAALLAMLNSCAANVTVVNIDNGFGAAYVASLVNRA
ncbi:MAG: nickel pincer cofactor biosynthesis protein LarB [Deltaproteobacteria bacterium]|nr:nickel pincer cofactor biosynthesis protein LarB [Deltaproteobacteria bacterium]